MRTIRRAVLLAITPGAGWMVTAAQAADLPNAPYQSDPAYAAAPAPQPYDRYGGGSARPVTGPMQAVSVAPPAGSYLAWGGKVEFQPQAEAPAPMGGWSGMTQRWSAAAPAQARVQALAAQQPLDNNWREAPPPVGAARPNLYDALRPSPPSQPAPYPQTQAAPAPPIQVARAQNAQGGPRFYSLHREYGLQPDAIPLPPQFFGPTADLSTPNTDPLVKRTTTVNGKTQTVAVPEDQGAP